MWRNELEFSVLCLTSILSIQRLAYRDGDRSTGGELDRVDPQAHRGRRQGAWPQTNRVLEPAVMRGGSWLSPSL